MSDKFHIFDDIFAPKGSDHKNPPDQNEEPPMKSVDELLEEAMGELPVGCVNIPLDRQATVRITRNEHEESGRNSKEKARKDLRDSISREMQLNGPRNEDEVYEAAARLHTLSPWAKEFGTAVMNDMLEHVEDMPWLHMRPTLLVGPPGCGKTTVATQMAIQYGVPHARIDVAASVFDVSGVEFAYTNAYPSRPIETISKTGVANPVIIVDEIDKYARTSNGVDPSATLLPLLEPSTSEDWRCIYSGLSINMSFVNFVLVANNLDLVPKPLVDRCRVIHIPMPTKEHMIHIMRVNLEDRVDEDIINMATQKLRTMDISLRALDRLCGRLIALERGAAIRLN